MTNASSKTKILLLIIGVLLIANIVLVILFLTGKEQHKAMHHDKKAMIAEFLQKEIGFDKLQLQQYDSLSNRHEEKVKPLIDAVRTNKELQFKKLAGDGFSDSAITVVAQKIAEKQQTIELQMLLYIKGIRNLCTPAQEPRFDSLFYKMLNKKKEEKAK